ncbi:Gfo/Idh/MocA family protein [uncultured Enterococcus sp.]|uniref:Gfo/Idh/MocA family protein n=1 Tax=uncultured Enterococcus sp. TaxID=167972 RepID=UPI0025F53048|nr:Gfo/Idh/MocA family oxidoreductase [uncultured Enterococcus sp.]
MLRLGIIGTNWISQQFVQAALASTHYRLHSVYSRKIASAEKFIEETKQNQAFASADMEAFLADETLDVVYIASPNALHFEQAKQAILNKKHVIVEKPAFSNPAEMDEIIQLANEQRVCYFEGARNIHERNFQTLKATLPTKNQIMGASFTYMKYSSRYDEVLAGHIPNIFSLDFSGGALMDLGVYPIYAAVGLFGAPKTVDYTAQKISTGVDGSGYGVLRYDDFDVAVHFGKTADSFATSEIYLTDGTIVLDGINIITSAKRTHRATNETTEISLHAKHENPLYEEACAFATILLSLEEEAMATQYEELVELSRCVNLVLYEMRQKAGIHFPADQKMN